MLNSVNLFQFKNTIRKGSCDMFFVTEACVEMNTLKSLTTGTGVNSLSSSVILNDESFCKSCGTPTARTLVLSGLIKREFLQHH